MAHYDFFKTNGVKPNASSVLGRLVRVVMIAFAAVLLAIIIRSAFWSLLENQSPFLILIFSVFIASLFGGIAAGMAATVLSVLAAVYLFFEPVNTLWIATLADWGMILAFVIEAFLISALTGFYRNTRLKAEESLAVAECGLASERSLHLQANTLLERARRSEAAQRELSESLRESQEKFRLLIDALTSYAVFLIDLDGNVSSWSRGAKLLFGYDEDEVVGKKAEFLFTAEDRQSDVPSLELSMARKAGEAPDNRWHARKDGSRFWASGTMNAVKADDGRTLSFVKILCDETKSKNIQDSLEEQRKWLEAVLDQMPIPFYLADPGSRSFSFANAAAVKLASGLRPQDMSFEDFMRSFGVSDQEGKPYPVEELPITKAFHGEPSDGQELVLEMGGTRKNIIVYTSILPPMLGHDQTVVLTALDFSRLKKVEEDLKIAKRKAEEASQAKSNFIANISHEIRTPLGAILGFTDLMKSPSLTADERLGYVDVVLRNGRQLAALINDILDLSKAESGRIESERSNTDIRELLDDVLKLFEAQASRKGVSLVKEVNASVPDVLLLDGTRLRQILVNLIGNALKFTPTGEIKVVVKLGRQTNGKPLAIRFEVHDTGIGLLSEHQARVFQPFTQADASTTRKYGGTGLGLSLSRKLARALGGDLRLLRSEPGKGSVFVLTLDALPAEQQRAPHAPEGVNGSRAAHGSAAGRVRRLAGKRVLVADDAPDNQLLIDRLLRAEGAEVRTASNGVEAIDRAEHEEFDAVLMDIQMPMVDGYQATRTLREHGYKKPIIALTAHAFAEERRKTFEAGCNDHVTKPVDRERLVSAIEHLVYA